MLYLPLLFSFEHKKSLFSICREHKAVGLMKSCSTGSVSVKLQQIFHWRGEAWLFCISAHFEVTWHLCESRSCSSFVLWSETKFTNWPLQSKAKCQGEEEQSSSGKFTHLMPEAWNCVIYVPFLLFSLFVIVNIIHRKLKMVQVKFKVYFQQKQPVCLSYFGSQ